MKVRQFYESDEVSRMLPGKKDYVTVRKKDGSKEKLQKRLVLGSLTEIYELYKKDQSNPKIGFSRFAALRPRNCVLAGSAGTHAVCVCTYHQNPKLLIAALDLGKLTYHDLMNHCVCDVTNRQCMMNECTECPGEAGIYGFLKAMTSDGDDSDEEDDDDDAEVRYRQWESTDRCTLIEKVETRGECVRLLCRQIRALTAHHYRAHTQSAYFAQLKDSAPDGEVVIQGDFSENFSFTVQDEAQGFHWDTSQCTIHPFVAYWRDQGEVHHKSFCCITDDRKHDPAMVHVFCDEVVREIRGVVPQLTKVHYFTDGCAAQYKNRYNFVNICHHEEDFGVKCEWNFFATSHGKGACDGIGGTVKRAAYQESLRRPYSDQILDVEALHSYLVGQFRSAIRFIFVPSVRVAEKRQMLKARFAKAVAIRGTQRYHRFTPVTVSSLRVHELSTDEGRVVSMHARTKRSK